MLRTLLAASLPALVVAFSWVRLDEGGAPVYAAVALAIAPVLLPRLGLRLAALAPALVGAPASPSEDACTPPPSPASARRWP